MKILISNDGPHAHYYIRMSWLKVFSAMGHEVQIWEKGQRPAFDVFDEFEPDIFMGQTYNLNEATFKCIKQRPHMKVVMRASDWGDIQKDIDLEKYPILVAQEEEKKLLERLKEETGKPDFVHNHYHDNWIRHTHNKWEDIGIKPISLIHGADIFDFYLRNPVEALRCDIGFVGGYWPYKAINLDEYLIKLCHPVGKYNIKLFGNSNWPVTQYCGRIASENVGALFASATISPNISEPHSQDFGYDIIERPFKVLMSGGFCISDYVESMANDVFTNGEIIFAKTPKEFKTLVDYYVKNPLERFQHIQAGYQSVVKNHTYFDRMATVFSALGLESEAKRCIEVKGSFFEEGL
tara:strand:+ start:3684 stop:4736 length:1053 start_codon:yes stop_codon:yes gene_type:complete